jgi:hypothetical protein
MTKMTLNTEGLNQTLAYIKAHPEEWNQGSWGKRTSCGTTYCFAGTWAHVSGAELLWEQYPNNSLYVDVVKVGGKKECVDDYAARTLGLTDDEQEKLFYSKPTLEQLEDMIDRISTGLSIDDYPVESI